MLSERTFRTNNGAGKIVGIVQFIDVISFNFLIVSQLLNQQFFSGPGTKKDLWFLAEHYFIIKLRRRKRTM